jgi:hypothetical protein
MWYQVGVGELFKILSLSPDVYISKFSLRLQPWANGSIAVAREMKIKSLELAGLLPKYIVIYLGRAGRLVLSKVPKEGQRWCDTGKKSEGRRSMIRMDVMND